LIAGTSFRGQYEKRLQAVINEATADPNVILFIDEMHNLIGAGSAIGAPMDAANMLKPALASGQLRVIGATTEIEYERFIRSDAALERRFQPVLIHELGRDESLEVLRARRTRLEMHHLVAISDEALEAAVDMSAKYLPDRKQPDRSIDLLDESCARLRMIQPVELPQAIIELKAERDRLIIVKRESIKEMLLVAEARGNPLERFSRGTFKMLEAMGLGVEKILTGQTTPRRPLPVPDSVKRVQERDPVGQLARLHYELLRVEDALKQLLTKDGVVIRREHIEAAINSNT
jgi:ATP-dependent Clp protease ATP-binding subunit ClpA